MSWVAIPERLGDDPRLDDAGDGGLAALVRLYCYVSSHETDGLISRARAERIVSREMLSTLQRVGFLECDANSIRIVDFLVHNLSHERREHHRAESRKRVERFRKSRGNASCNAVTNAVSNVVSNATDRDRTVQEQIPESGKTPPSADPSPSAQEVQKPKPERKLATGDHPELIRLWEQLFEEATGSKPTINYSADGNNLKARLKTHTRAVIEARMRRCFAERIPDWKWRDGPFSLSVFLSPVIFDALASIKSKPPREPKVNVPDEFTNNPNVYTREEHRKVEEFHARRNAIIAQLQSDQP